MGQEKNKKIKNSGMDIKFIVQMVGYIGCKGYRKAIKPNGVSIKKICRKPKKSCKKQTPRRACSPSKKIEQTYN